MKVLIDIPDSVGPELDRLRALVGDTNMTMEIADEYINYERDHSGECRIDPDDGNAYVLREVGHSVHYGYGVIVNDIMGGHSRTLTVDVWLNWIVADDKLCPGDLERAGEVIRAYDAEKRS